jgi:hypothetical protein
LPCEKATKLREVLTSLQALLRLAVLHRLGVFICALATLLSATGNASALEPAQTKTRVWGFDFAEHNSAGLFRAATGGKHLVNRLAGAEEASDSLLAARGATALAKVELNIGKHAAKQMAERGITESMVKVGLEKGIPFIDPKNGTINYVLKEGFASGNDLLVGTNPLTGKITTVIRGTDLVSPRLIPYTP